MYNIYDIILLVPVILLMIYWWHTSEQKRVAVVAARDYCKQRKLQLLDESLVFRKFRVERDLQRRRSLCRVYEFDYCPDGKERHTGEIVLRGLKIMRVIVHSDALEITQY
jgi:hypothetical protein